MKMVQQQLAGALVLAMLVVVAVNCSFIDDTNKPLQEPCKLPDGFQRCDNSGAYIKDFRMKGCEGGSPCKFKVDEPVEIYIRFGSFEDYYKLVMNLDVTYDHYSSVLSSQQRISRVLLREYTRTIRFGESLKNALETDKMTLTLTNGSKTLICLKFPIQVEGAIKEESDFVDQLEGHFVLKRPDGKKISRALAQQLVGQQIAWPSGAKLSQPQADQLEGAELTVTF